MANLFQKIFSRNGKSNINSLFLDNGLNSHSQTTINIGKTSIILAEFTRENNATPYSIGDVISSSASVPTVLHIPNVFRVNGGSGFVSNARVIFNVKNVVPILRLHFFNSATPSVAGDNLPHKELYVDCSKRLGWIDLPAMTTAIDSTNSDMSRTMSTLSSGIAVKALDDSKDLYVLLQTMLAVTLTAQSKVSVVLSVVND